MKIAKYDRCTLHLFNHLTVAEVVERRKSAATPKPSEGMTVAACLSTSHDNAQLFCLPPMNVNRKATGMTE